MTALRQPVSSPPMNIQQLFGHEKLETTAIYTEVSIQRLREVHARCHPAGKPRKPPGDDNQPELPGLAEH